MRIICILLVILLVSGCGPENTKTAQTVSPDDRVQTLLDSNEYQQAAEAALELAQLYPNRASDYQLKAAQIFLDAGNPESAAAVLSNMTQPGDDNRLAFDLLSAEVAVSNSDPVRAITLLNRTATQASLTREQTKLLLRTRINAYIQQGNLIYAVRDHITLAAYLDTQSDLAENTSSTWSLITGIDLQTLQQERPHDNPEFASWLELAIIYQSMFFRPQVLEQSVMMWREQYPRHPANGHITDEILLSVSSSSSNPRHVALILPFSVYERESKAIRDGFLAAWFASTTYQPQISVYDYDTLNINTVYSRAVAGGADFIVGPLDKKAIENLVNARTIQQPTLALNQIDSSGITELPDENGMPMLVQYGLAPEDEARQVAKRASADGYSRALVITPDNSWGKRLIESFQSAWEGHGGKVMETITYPENTNEYKTWVKSLLNINSSDQRSNILRSRLNRTSLESESRLREDADMIFMPASPASARRIVPEFRFYQTGIPIYSTSEVYTGILNPQLDKDIDGVKFTHMPWILKPSVESSSLQNQVNRNWNADRSGYRRFYAFGVDAFRLIPNLSRMTLQNAVHFPGETGDLYMSGDYRIQRELIWGLFSEGTPVIIE